jgi:hypothetical protein
MDSLMVQQVKNSPQRSLPENIQQWGWEEIEQVMTIKRLKEHEKRLIKSRRYV